MVLYKIAHAALCIVSNKLSVNICDPRPLGCILSFLKKFVTIPELFQCVNEIALYVVQID